MNPSKPRFDVAAFEGLIQRRGRDFVWERARRCACQNPRTRSPLENCPQCHGVGWAYTTMGTFRATILGIMGSKQWARFGEWLTGDAQISYSASLLMGDKDRITLTTGEYRESCVLTKGKNDVIPEVSVFEVIECGDLQRLYVAGRDFVLRGPEVVWQGQQPTDGSTYSVLYRARPVYVIWMVLPQIRAQVQESLDANGQPVFAEMPRKAALRRWVDFVRGST